MADHDVLIDRLEHALESIFDVLDHLVDDIVVADLDARLLCTHQCRFIHTDAKAMMTALLASASITSDSEMSPILACRISSSTSSLPQPVEAVDDWLERTLHIGVHDWIERLGFANRHAGKEVFEGHGRAWRLLAGHICRQPALSGDATSYPCRSSRAPIRRRHWHLLEAQYHDRHARTGFLQRLAFVVKHGLNAAPRLADYDRVAVVHGAVLHEQSGRHAAILIQLSLPLPYQCMRPSDFRP